METWLQIALTAFASFAASSGFWAYMQARMQSKDQTKDATVRLLMGMAYDRITALGGWYINRGWVTKDEYEELQKYFFEPYIALGGNGTAKRIMAGVTNLPIRTQSRYVNDDRQNEEFSRHVRVVPRADEEISFE